jgi:hypothetical protein
VASRRPNGWFRCIVALDLIGVGPDALVRGEDGLAETGLDYAVLRYSNGDFEVQCTADLGSADQGSGSGYYPAPIVAAADRRCTANSDFDDPGSGIHAGFWHFSSQTERQQSWSSTGTRTIH